MPTNIFYTAHEHEGAHRYQVTLLADYDLRDDSWNDTIAEQCAEDWHGNHDGWEANWPRVFTLYATKNGPSFGKFEIDRETVPQFNAVQLKEPQRTVFIGTTGHADFLDDDNGNRRFWPVPEA